MIPRYLHHYRKQVLFFLYIFEIKIGVFSSILCQ